MFSPATLDRTRSTVLTMRETPPLRQWAEAFITARRAERKTTGTIRYYTEKLKHFLAWCDKRGVVAPEELTAQHVREFLLHLEETAHNPGGIHAYFRAVKTFVRWWATESEPAGWRDPFEKVRAPKVPEDLLDPVDAESVRALLKASATRQSERNRAIILVLFDAGLRASEVTALDAGDVDAVSGGLAVRRGKGQKGRIVFLGQKARRAMRAYLRKRGDSPGPLFLAEHGGRLTYKGLRAVVHAAADRAGIPRPPLHSFRRAFALNCLRSGMDPMTLQRLMGHANLDVLRRYLKQSDTDLAQQHALYSPADRAKL